MEHTSEKRCPSCGGRNVRYVGIRDEGVGDCVPGRDILGPRRRTPIYECREKNCGNTFLYFGE
jgi:hypothetical protein